jgi:hypothetical protein
MKLSFWVYAHASIFSLLGTTETMSVGRDSGACMAYNLCDLFMDKDPIDDKFL